MDGDEPQVRDTGLEDRIDLLLAVEPAEESLHLACDEGRLGRFEMHMLAADRTGDNLHGARFVTAPGADADFCKTAPPGREQGRMPAEQSILRQRFLVVRR